MSDNNIYRGTDYGFDPTYGLSESYGESFLGVYPRVSVAQIGIATDPRSANQLKAVSDKLNTGAKTIELSPVQPEVFESIPDQHLKEINRLKKLAGIDLTFHGPLVEPTGLTKRGWQETDREQAERQMWSAVKRAQVLEKDGNLVITFHSSNGLPEPETKSINPKTGKEEIKNFWVIDERTGDLNAIPTNLNYFEGQDKSQESQRKLMQNSLEKQNKDAWYRQLQHVNFNAYNGAQIVNSALGGKEAGEKENDQIKEAEKNVLSLYKTYTKNPEEAEKEMKKWGEYEGHIKRKINNLIHGDIYVRDSYGELQNLFNTAYDNALRDNRVGDKKKLDKFRTEMAGKIKELDDPAKIHELSNTVIEGVNLLRTISPPQSLKPLRDFGIDKASETFSNVALNSYNEFKDKSPIISIENPPVGMGLARADELKDLVETTRKKFVEKAVEQGISKSEAESQSKKLIGTTWDVGHINMLRKYGHDEKKLLEETKKMAPYVKHVHLSDNFGMEHTELPMGMGNVPIKKEMEIISQYNEKAKKIIEAGNWYQFFQKTPLTETFAALGSPVYGMKMSPYWNQTADKSGAGRYFAGYGTNPDIHHTYFGAGFSNLPVELGGQGQTSGRSRLSGTPNE